jgi:hypothetical protein
MEFRRVSTEKVDWDKLDHFSDRLVSQTRAWCEFVAETQGGEVVLAELTTGGKIVGYFSGLLVRQLGIPILGSPFIGWSTSYMGFNLEPTVSRKQAMRELERFAFNDLRCLHIELTDRYLHPEDGIDLGFKHRLLTTYISDLSLSEDDLYRSFASAKRRNIRKAEREGVKIEHADDMEFAAEYYVQLQEVFSKQGLKPTYGVERVRAFIKHLYPTGNLLLLRARNQEGITIATGIFVGFNLTSYFWGNASARQHLHMRPNELIHWYAMRFWKARGVRWHDWSGPGDYKKKYGPELLQVPHFYKSKYKLVEFGREAAHTAFYLPRRVKSNLHRCRRNVVINSARAPGENKCAG